MCIRDRGQTALKTAEKIDEAMGGVLFIDEAYALTNSSGNCLLYTSDAADDLLCVDLGGRRIIKKKKTPFTDRST